MSQYTTGELAKLCGVTVRTVQYYDTRGILIPSALSEGGRRLYSDDDLRRMRIICFLRNMGLPIDAIGQLLSEEEPGRVITLLLEQQQQTLRRQLAEDQEKLEKVMELQRQVKQQTQFSVESIGDIAELMEKKEQLRRIHITLILAGIPMSLLEITGIVLWIVLGLWWPFALYLLACIPFGIVISRYYFRRVAYICPQCHTVFRPVFREAFFARHTPTARKLTCRCCGYHGFCIETAAANCQTE